MRFDFQRALSNSILVNQYPSAIPDLSTYEADWYAGAWLYYRQLQPGESENYIIRLGYANSSDPQSTSDVKWVISGKVVADYTSGQFSHALSMASYSKSASWAMPTSWDDLFRSFNDDNTYDIFSQQHGACTSETSVGILLDGGTTDYGCLPASSLTHNYSCPSPNIYVSRDSIINIMRSGYVYLCIYAYALDVTNPSNPHVTNLISYYESEDIPAGQTHGNITLLNQNGFGWIVKNTSFSDTFKVKEGERNWKGIEQSYVNVGEYDEEENYIQTWKPIEQIKVKVGGVGTGSWKTLASTENVVIF